MRVTKGQRKDATLLMMYSFMHNDYGQPWDGQSVTAYKVASWHSIAQSNAWEFLNELCKSRFVKRHTNPGENVVITYSLTKRGRNYVTKHILECTAARDEVFAWKLAKYKRSLLK